jgi:hypothetical protein
MTLIGAVLIPLAIFLAFRRPEKLIAMLVFWSALQATSVLNIGQFGLSPYNLVACLIFARFVFRMVTQLKLVLTKRTVPLMWFYLWAAFSAAFLPIVFSGLPVVVPRVALEQIIQGLTPLHIGASNFIQLALLTLNIGVFLEAQRFRKNLWPVFRATIILEIVVVGLQAILGDHYPYFLLNNSAEYYVAHFSSLSIVARPSGTFTEASVAGAFFTGAAAITLVGYLNGRLKVWLCLACIGATVLMGSGSGMAGFAIILILIIIKLRPWHCGSLDLARLRRWGLLFASILIAAVFFSSLVTQVTESTVGKGDSFSFLVRTSVDLAALKVFAQTKGLGVGLGSFRGSSVVATMLASIGLPGILLFLWFLKRFRPSYLVGGTLFAMAVGVPDISLPMLWAALIVESSVRGNLGNSDFMRGKSSAPTTGVRPRLQAKSAVESVKSDIEKNPGAILRFGLERA